jgi:ketosteroid isomerase-like protein
MNHPERNKSTLEAANAAIANGDHEGFLSFCTDDTTWSFVGESTLEGKDAVRQWMKVNYRVPPKFRVSELIAEKAVVIALGKITLPGKNQQPSEFSYCDIWRFKGGKMAKLTAFVIEDRR